MISVYSIYDKTLNSNKEIESLIPIISDTKKNKVEKIRSKKDKNQHILGDVLLRFALWEIFDFNIYDINFKYTRYGKPFLHNNNVYFNISHSGNRIVCGISDSLIGIDVEQITPNIGCIAQRFFTAEENYYINKHSSEKQYETFFKIWTLKESYIKCMGKGLRIPLNTFSFDISNKDILLYQGNKQSNSYSFYSMMLFDKYYLGLCVKRKKDEIWNGVIKHVSVQQLVNWGHLYYNL